MSGVVERLLISTDPSVRFKAHSLLLSNDTRSDKMLRLQQEVKRSPRSRLLLSERALDGSIRRHPYAKWDGAHWVLAALADLGYPPGDKSLIPLREQVYKWLLSKHHEEYTEARPYRHHPSAASIKDIRERPRIHASMEGNAIWSLLTLDLVDDRVDSLIERLLRTQWPDGGWNCDGDPHAHKSSFMESLLPLRALALHTKLTGDPSSRRAAERAADVFLKRRLYKRASNGAIISGEFTELHYPCYWHYDVLIGLKVMAESGHVRDRRCDAALDLLASKRLRGGGFPADAKYYRASKSRGGRSLVDWGPARRNFMNEFVTVDALWVLKEAGRLRL